MNLFVFQEYKFDIEFYSEMEICNHEIRSILEHVFPYKFDIHKVYISGDAPENHIPFWKVKGHAFGVTKVDQ